MYLQGLGLWVIALGIVDIIIFVFLIMVVWRDHLFLRRFFSKDAGDYKKTLESLLLKTEELDGFKEESSRFISKVLLKRYNPYNDTGGDQSFSVVFLDKENNGVVLTSLHSRSGTRVFAKPVKTGKEDNFRFSAEEEQLVSQTAKI